MEGCEGDNRGRTKSERSWDALLVLSCSPLLRQWRLQERGSDFCWMGICQLLTSETSAMQSDDGSRMQSCPNQPGMFMPGKAVRSFQHSGE